MKRWLYLFLMLIPCNGCMMIEDMLMVDDGPNYPAYQSAAQQPAGSCGMPIANVAAKQTAEPELLQVRR